MASDIRIDEPGSIVVAANSVRELAVSVQLAFFEQVKAEKGLPWHLTKFAD